MFSLEISNLFDSHVHFLSTGQCAARLNLIGLKAEIDLEKWEILPHHYQGSWLVGYGWDENKWQPVQLPHRKTLDQLFPCRPVFFIRADGHSSWVNTKVLELLKIPLQLESGQQKVPTWFEFVDRDCDGFATGILREEAHLAVFAQMPPLEKSQMKQALQKGIQIFNQAGFTHIRDMSSTVQQWDILRTLEDSGELTLFIDSNITCESINDLDLNLESLSYAQKHSSVQMKACGVKIYYDGSLGSETARLSQPYGGHSEKRGHVFWQKKDIETLLVKAWERNLEVSVHTIGDQAVDDIVDIARKISAMGHVGKLNLEHVEVVRPETIQKMKPLHIRCHLQPCHWHTDRVWLHEKLGNLFQYAFPWESLRTSKIPFNFGSDSPIESPSLLANLTAIQQSSKFGIRAFKGDPITHHIYPLTSSEDIDSHRCQTAFVNGEVAKLIFRGKDLLRDF